MEKSFVSKKPIKGLRKDIGKYLRSLFSSILNVKSCYIHYDGHNKKGDYEHVERVFAYELYHQWCNNLTIKRNKNLFINAEIPKNLIDEARNSKISLMYPDLVLHLGQNENKGNLIICEIKREEYAQQHPSKMYDDFKKLRLYLSDKLKVKINKKDWDPFELGVFILTIKEDNLKPILSVSRIIECLNDEEYENLCAFKPDISQRIFCVVYNGKELKYDTLYNIINER